MVKDLLNNNENMPRLHAQMFNDILCKKLHGGNYVKN